MSFGRIEKEVFVLLFDGFINLIITLQTEGNVLVCKYRVFCCYAIQKQDGFEDHIITTFIINEI